MGKALVLPEVDFSVNKLTTVIVNDPIPCTGISLSQNSLSFTSLTSISLTATLTPADTTDAVSWSSSDTSVATVSNGTVTAVGVGTATITATCGNQSATCSVAVTVVISDDDFAIINHRVLSGTALENNKDYAGSYTSGTDGYKVYFLYLSDIETESGYKALTGSNELYDNKYPIMIPNNAEIIEVETHDAAVLVGGQIVFFDSTQRPTYSTSDKGCKAVSNITAGTISSGKGLFTIPSNVDGLDSFGIYIKLSAGQDNPPGELTMTFKKA